MRPASGAENEILCSGRVHIYCGLAMTVPCIRCPGLATALLTYDHAAAQAYLDDATGVERAYDGILLCSSHAGRFAAPVGWNVVDRRGGPSGVFLPEAMA